jgi:uncharacterized membrane protein
MEARIARKEKEVPKTKARRGKTLASKTKGRTSASSKPAQTGSAIEASSAAPPPVAQSSGLAGDKTPEVQVLTPASAPGRKRAASEPQEPSAAKKEKAAVCAEESATWQPAWSLKVDGTAMNDEKLCVDFLTNAVLPLDADEVGARSDAALIKSAAAEHYRVCP